MQLSDIKASQYLTLSGLDGQLQYELARFFLNTPSTRREISARVDNVYAYIRTHALASSYDAYIQATQARRAATARALEKAGVLRCVDDHCVYTLTDPRAAADFIQLHDAQ